MNNCFVGNFKMLELGKEKWHAVYQLMTKTQMKLDISKSGLGPKDMEGFSYIFGDGPFGMSKITSLNLSRNFIKKEGAKNLVPAL